MEEEEEEPELLVKNIEDIEVKAGEEIPVTEHSDKGVKRYSLDDYEEMEAKLNQAKPASKKEEVAEEELKFETKTVEKPVKEKDNDEPADPLNSPISKLLSDRTEERKRKMKEFNYKFRNSNSKIDEIEIN